MQTLKFLLRHTETWPEAQLLISGTHEACHQSALITRTLSHLIAAFMPLGLTWTNNGDPKEVWIACGHAAGAIGDKRGLVSGLATCRFNRLPLNGKCY